MDHTPEPWKKSGASTDVWYDGPHRTQRTVDEALALDRRIAMCGMPEFPRLQNEANAQRIAACVNACAGISTEDLERLTEGHDGQS